MRYIWLVIELDWVIVYNFFINFLAKIQ